MEGGRKEGKINNTSATRKAREATEQIAILWLDYSCMFIRSF